eukprot:gnl/TRDRNA2_/TRDRNA2_52719_c0_seq1.p1 gnl/TRDRNA2_/TRDRNA2_52719_c0~~gnl/TRDRNA2_/TRDRNA2_52719_c0_seq1.p1  ORF type:complete len:510 (-),score=67.21 gnl/TRDRNA2_/TRDRNA2_52719_c0_seq1:776-2305(-)
MQYSASTCFFSEFKCDAGTSSLRPRIKEAQRGVPSAVGYFWTSTVAASCARTPSVPAAAAGRHAIWRAAATDCEVSAASPWSVLPGAAPRSTGTPAETSTIPSWSAVSGLQGTLAHAPWHVEQSKAGIDSRTPEQVKVAAEAAASETGEGSALLSSAGGTASMTASNGQATQPARLFSYPSPQPTRRRVCREDEASPATTPSTSAGPSPTPSPRPSPRASPRRNLRPSPSPSRSPSPLFTRGKGGGRNGACKGLRLTPPRAGGGPGALALRRLLLQKNACCHHRDEQHFVFEEKVEDEAGSSDDENDINAQDSEVNEEVRALAEGLLFESLPPENVADLRVTVLQGEQSRLRFLDTLASDGGHHAWPRVKTAWHLAGGRHAVSSILHNGIRCDEEHCACGRYGRGGYVALSAAKANAYADSCGEEGTRRHLFLVFALPEEEIVRGERGVRPPHTAADLPACPTEYCFVDSSRLHCACLLTYRWVPTGRREKVSSAGPRVSHVVHSRPSR